MEHIILRKSDGTLTNNTFTWNNQVLEDAKEITVGRVTVYLTNFKKHLTVSSASLVDQRIRYGTKISKNVIRYLQPESIEKITVVTQEATSGVTREQIIALNPIYFLDWSDDAKLTMNGINPKEIGQNFHFLLGQMSSNLQVYSSANFHVLGAIGETRGGLSNGAWHCIKDSSTPNPIEPLGETTLLLMFRTSDNTGPWQIAFLSHLFKLSRESNLMQWYDDMMGRQTTSLVVDADSDYLLIIKRTATQFLWTLRNLATEAEQTETTDNGNKSYASNNYSMAWGTAQTGATNTTWGHTVLIPTHSDTAINLVKSWMIEKYTGVEGTAEVSGDIFRLQDNQSNKVKTRSGRNFDITFSAEDVPFEPEDFVIDLEVKY